MKRLAVIAITAISALSLQGCVAALLPIAAAGAIGKTKIDAAKRARQAEDTMVGVSTDPQSTDIPSSTTVTPIVTVGGQETAEEKTPVKEAPQTVEDNGAYEQLVRFALDQLVVRSSGKAIRSAVLVENVSLFDPRAVPCGDKPLAVVIDADTAPGSTPASVPDMPVLLNSLRNAEIRVAWISDLDQAALEAALRSAGVRGALLSDNDILLPARGDDLRKQERRWKLAEDFCVVAVAGDDKADFDELYGYLRNPDYAIRLDMFWNRGWFEVPPLSI